MDGSPNIYTEGKELDSKQDLLYDCMHMMFWKKQILSRMIETRRVIVSVCERAKGNIYILMGMWITQINEFVKNQTVHFRLCNSLNINFTPIEKKKVSPQLSIGCS